jgi:AcrR family transcriptional regulator
MIAKQTKPRRTQEQRRRSTQDRILAATLDILADEGHTRFTTTRVAAKAGVSRGAQENYFPTKSDLIGAATKHAMKQATEEAAASAHAKKFVDDPVRGFLASAGEFFLSRNYTAMEELALAGRDDRALSRIHRAAFLKFRREHDNIWIEALTSAGYAGDKAKSLVDLTVYFLRGMALTALILPAQRREAEMLRQWEESIRLLIGPKKK